MLQVGVHGADELAARQLEAANDSGRQAAGARQLAAPQHDGAAVGLADRHLQHGGRVVVGVVDEDDLFARAGDGRADAGQQRAHVFSFVARGDDEGERDLLVHHECPSSYQRRDERR